MSLEIPSLQTVLYIVIPVLTIVFITSSSLVVCYIAISAYRSANLLGVLLLGCGALVFGSTSLIAVTSFRLLGVGFSSAVFATGSLISAGFHFGCASLTYRGGAPNPRGGDQLPPWIALAVLAIAVAVLAALEGFVPSFYMLGAASATFALSAAMMFAVFTSSKSGVLYWYSLALGATAAGLVGMILSNGSIGAAAMWAGWGGLYAGGIFLLESLLSAERLRDLPLANRARYA